MFTPWLRFKGGKGVATAVGAFAAIAPRAVLISLAVFIILVAITRYVSLGSIMGAGISLGCLLALSSHAQCLGMCLVGLSALLIIVRHRTNIRRLVAGTENRLW